MKDDKPAVKKLRDINNSNSAFNYASWKDARPQIPELPEAEPDIFAEEDGYLETMKRGPRELMAFKILDRAVRSLSKKQRDAYKLVYKDGFTLASAGLMLDGISPQAVKKLVDKALKNIARYCKLHEAELESAQ